MMRGRLGIGRSSEGGWQSVTADDGLVLEELHSLFRRWWNSVHATYTVLVLINTPANLPCCIPTIKILSLHHHHYYITDNSVMF